MKKIYIYWIDKVMFYVYDKGAGMDRLSHVELEKRELEVHLLAIQLGEKYHKEPIIRKMTELVNSNHRRMIHMIDSLL